MRFAVCGPFEVPRRNRHLVTRDAAERRQFWEHVEAVEEGLSDACGAYMLTIRAYPWYVGLAERQSFRNECFSAHKIMRYDSALSRVSGMPSLFFIAKPTPQAWFALPSRNGHRDIRMLENLLIGMAVSRNPELENIRGTRILRDMNVPGLLYCARGQGRSLAVQGLRYVLDV